MTDRDREIERLTEVFKDAILHAPIPDVNPNLIRTVESQARECALRVVGDQSPKDSAIGEVVRHAWRGYCGRGPCAAEIGHKGTCVEASGWAEHPDDEAVS